MINISIKVLIVYKFVESLGFDAVAWANIVGWTCMVTYGYMMFLYHKKHKWTDVYIYPTKEQLKKLFKVSPKGAPKSLAPQSERGFLIAIQIPNNYQNIKK